MPKLNSQIGQVYKEMEASLNEPYGSPDTIHQKQEGMNKGRLISCGFNMDSGCVEMQWENGTVLSIICDAVERSFETTLQQRTEMNWLIYNDPLSYAQLVLGGKLSDYLVSITQKASLLLPAAAPVH